MQLRRLVRDAPAGPACIQYSILFYCSDVDYWWLSLGILERILFFLSISCLNLFVHYPSWACYFSSIHYAFALKYIFHIKYFVLSYFIDVAPAFLVSTSMHAAIQAWNSNYLHGHVVQHVGIFLAHLFVGKNIMSIELSCHQNNQPSLAHDIIQLNYSDVIMSAMAFQTTCPTIVYSTIYSRRRSNKASKLHVTGLCEWYSPVTGEFPSQRASNVGNVSIWWRHNVYSVHITSPKTIMSWRPAGDMPLSEHTVP